MCIFVILTNMPPQIKRVANAVQVGCKQVKGICNYINDIIYECLFLFVFFSVAYYTNVQELFLSNLL